MKTYRLLKKGDFVEAEDQWYNVDTDVWCPATPQSLGAEIVGDVLIKREIVSYEDI